MALMWTQNCRNSPLTVLLMACYGNPVPQSEAPALLKTTMDKAKRRQKFGGIMRPGQEFGQCSELWAPIFEGGLEWRYNGLIRIQNWGPILGGHRIWFGLFCRLQRVGAWMQGSFSSALQAAKGPY